ncbi:MAG: hypothetical protein DLD55_03240 [candidate division SR1 bacterium]|nr:MAG: hypothetical protein DLD55_03240 [candidate division SR1 bacterium]
MPRTLEQKRGEILSLFFTRFQEERLKKSFFLEQGLHFVPISVKGSDFIFYSMIVGQQNSCK